MAKNKKCVSLCYQKMYVLWSGTYRKLFTMRHRKRWFNILCKTLAAEWSAYVRTLYKKKTLALRRIIDLDNMIGLFGFQL